MVDSPGSESFVDGDDDVSSMVSPGVMASAVCSNVEFKKAIAEMARSVEKLSRSPEVDEVQANMSEYAFYLRF